MFCSNASLYGKKEEWIGLPLAVVNGLEAETFSLKEQ